MNGSFMWEAEQVAREWAPRFLERSKISGVSATGIVNIAFRGGCSDQKLIRLAAKLGDRSHHEAMCRWASWYLNVRGLESVSLDKFLTLASSQPGTRRGITKTKLRKAARQLATAEAVRSLVA